MKSTAPILFDEYIRRNRAGWHGGITGQSLSMALNAFTNGDLRQAAMIWDKQSTRDMRIVNVKGKREKAVSRREWQILTTDDSAEAAAHKDALTEFWNNISVVNAFDRDEEGEFSLLVRQMMSAVSFRYAAHHLVWSPSSSSLGCEFEFVPLQFFEGHTGKLRFCPTGMETEGRAMPREEWMVTTGDGLMMSASIGAYAKADALTSWLIFNEAFAMPGVMGRTKQGKETDGGRAMEDAVATFCSDWRCVLFGDDGSGSIELIRTEGSASSIPFPALIEMVDRNLAALWRGADLSSMSSSSGQGQGASLQGGESDIIELDDALMVSEKLNRVERQVIAWHFGSKVRPKAYIRLLVPQSEDLKLLLDAINALVKLGAPIEVNDVLQRFGFGVPKKGAVLLGQEPEAEPDDEAAKERAARINADRAEDIFLRNSARLLAKASAEDRDQIVEQLKEILALPEGTSLVTALNAFVGQLPEQIGQDAAQVSAWERVLGTALVNGWAANSTPDDAV